MSTPLFSFVTPRFAEGKGSHRQERKQDYAMVKLYPEGKLVYRYYKLSDQNPAIQNRQIQLSEEELKAFLALLEQDKAALLSYRESRPLPFEAKRWQHSLIHAYGQLFLIPDYILDPRLSVYRDRYAYYPEAKTKAYYDALYHLAENLHQDLLNHRIYFAYQEHSDGEAAPAKRN